MVSDAFVYILKCDDDDDDDDDLPLNV